MQAAAAEREKYALVPKSQEGLRPSASAEKAWHHEIDANIAADLAGIANARRFLDMRPTADASGNALGIWPSDEQGFFPLGAEPGPRVEPVPGTMGPRRNGPDAFSGGIAKSFAEDVANRKAEAGLDVRELLAQQSPILGPLNDVITDFGIDVGRNYPVIGGGIQIARWLTIGDGSNADLLIAAAGPLARVEGRIGLTAEARLFARVEAAEAQRSAAKLAGYGVTETIEVSGRRAAADIAPVYEAGVREHFYGQTEEQAFRVVESGKLKTYYADATTEIAGRSAAVDAKNVDEWAGSSMNPANSRGPWDWEAQEKIVSQARRYSAAFEGGAIYHTNVVEFANAWSRIFDDAGLQNIKFIITPAVKK